MFLFRLLLLWWLINSSLERVQGRSIYDSISETIFQFESVKNISTAIVQIIERSFVREAHHFSFNLFARVEQKQLRGFVGKLMDHTLKALDSAITAYVGVGSALPKNSLRRHGVMLVDSAKSLSFLYREFAKYHLHVRGFYLIFLFSNRKTRYMELENILKLNYNFNIINANVLLHDKNGVFAYTTFPYNNIESCGSSKFNLYNRFINLTWDHQNFYPSKVTNLNKCPIECNTWQNMPYLALRSNIKTGQDELIGIEGKLLEFLALKMNFTIQIRWLTEADGIRAHQDQNSFFNTLFSNGTDAVIGSLHYKWAQLEDPIAPTYYHYLSEYNFIVSSTEHYGAFQKLLLPFENSVWLCILLIFACGILVGLTAAHLKRSVRSLLIGHRNEAPVFHMIVVSLGGTVEPPPRRNMARFLLMVWLLSTIVLRSIYLGYLYHFIKSDIRMPPPNTIDEVVDRGYAIYMSKTTFNLIAHLEYPRAQMNILNLSVAESFPLLSNSDVRSAILAPSEIYEFYKRTHTDAKPLHVVKEKLFTQGLSFYMPKSSALLTEFDVQIGNYINVGLMTKWENAFVRDKMHKTVRTTDDQPKVMNLQKLFGAFLLLLIGNAISFSCFVGEVFIDTIGRRRNKSN